MGATPNGESYLQVLNELYDHSQIQLISGRYEGGVSFMAEPDKQAVSKLIHVDISPKYIDNYEFI